MTSAATRDPDARRTVVVIRHAHAGNSEGGNFNAGNPNAGGDHQRELDRRGRREATAAGQWLARTGPTLDLVLVSDAVRTRQTWELMSAELTDPPTAIIEPLLYNCSLGDLVDQLAADRARVPVVAVVGHNPAVSELAWFLAGHDGPALVPAEIAVIAATIDATASDDTAVDARADAAADSETVADAGAGVLSGHLLDGFTP